jgi:small subunit ribosomal protein S6
MNKYELLLIIPGKVKDSDLPASMTELKALFAKYGAEIVSETVWGRMKLSYEIKHEKTGVYVLWHLNVEPSKAQGLQNELNVSENVLRYLFIDAPTHGKTIPSPIQVRQEEKEREMRENGTVKKDGKEYPDSGLAKKDSAPVENDSDAKSAAKAPASKKAGLDKKLEDILGEEI